MTREFVQNTYTLFGYRKLKKVNFPPSEILHDGDGSKHDVEMYYCLKVAPRSEQVELVILVLLRGKLGAQSLSTVPCN